MDKVIYRGHFALIKRLANEEKICTKTPLFQVEAVAQPVPLIDSAVIPPVAASQRAASTPATAGEADEEADVEESLQPGPSTLHTFNVRIESTPPAALQIADIKARYCILDAQPILLS